MTANEDNNNNKDLRFIGSSSLDMFEKKRVAVYARISQVGELKHQSIEAQKANLKTDIAKHPDWEFVGFYVDEGVTGTKMNRPEFSRMLHDARAGKIDIILTKSVSRFGRNASAVLKILQELKSIDVIVIFDNEHINTADNNGLIRLQYLSIMAEREAKQTSDYQKWAIQNRFKEGIPCYIRPYGYKMIDHQLYVIPEEAEVVKRIYRMYLDGTGLSTISRTLNLEGITTRYGYRWTPSPIKQVLTNVVYVGDLLLQKTFVTNFLTKQQKKNKGELPQYLIPNNHEAIIDRDTFDQVQAELKRRAKLYPWLTCSSNERKDRIFSQLIRCGHCNKAMKYKKDEGNGSVREAWVCTDYEINGKEICPVGYIREDILIDNIREVLLSENLIKEDTILTNQLLKTHIQVILTYEKHKLEIHLLNGKVFTRFWKNHSRKKSWTPEMKQKAREKAIIQRAKERERKEQMIGGEL